MHSGYFVPTKAMLAVRETAERLISRSFAASRSRHTAAACAWALGLCARGSTIAVHMPGGTLWVREKAGQLLLTGPVQAVFEGKAEI